MRKNRNRARITIEWTKTLDNIGVMIPLPEDILLKYLDGKDLIQITNSFFEGNLEEINLLDICALNRFWWKNSDIVAARTSWFKHPTQHSSELIFDKSNQRIKIQMRQLDLDGKHWLAEHIQHIHLIRGEINKDDACDIIKVNFKEHVKLIRPIIQGKYIMKIR